MSLRRCCLLIFALLLCASVASAAEYKHEFTFKPQGSPQRVNVAGDFNGWSSDATPMSKGADGAWHATVSLPEGVAHYKFIVNGSQWMPDPNSDHSLDSDDNYGGHNSGVLIGPDLRKIPPPQPNNIHRQAVLFDPKSDDDFDIVKPGVVRFRVRTQADDVESVSIDGKKQASLAHLGRSGEFDEWGGVVNLQDADQGGVIHYAVKLQDGTATFQLNNLSFPAQKTPVAQTPDWAKHAVWYQIFPERFRNGDPSNDPGDHDYEHMVRWTSDWWKAQPGEAPGEENFYKGKGNVWKRRYGGDVQGLIQSLPYLRSLGVNAIYLNPMFEADSMHKYDTSDYRHIDDNFGFKGDIAQLKGETDDPSTWQWTKTDKLFLDFVQQAHQQGFKVILDGVFNHVGRDFWAFQDVLKNGRSSKYAGWFDIRDWNPPIKYIAWDTGNEATDHGALPVFKKDPNPGLADGPRQHVLAIAKRWLAPDGDPSRGIDGFRLDVPGDIPHPFWVEFRKVVKATKPDAYISGEIWTWAQPWLQGDQFDAVMNYPFAVACQQFFVNRAKAITPTQFNEKLDELEMNYPFQVALDQMNLFDSHDTDRFASMFVNPDLPYDAANRIQDNGPNYSPAKPTPVDYQRMRQAVAFQMAFIGAPMIYYGDEAGMWSPDDPSNRQPMTWPEMKFDDPQVKFDPSQFAFYQRAIAAREKIAPLQLGFFHAIDMEDEKGVFAFERDLRDQHAYVILNRSPVERTVRIHVPEKNGVKLVNWLDSREAELVPATSRDLNGRATLAAKPQATETVVNSGECSIQLGAYESAILSRP